MPNPLPKLDAAQLAKLNAVFEELYQLPFGEFLEQMKREWLDRGIARGEQHDRPGMPFALVVRKTQGLPADKQMQLAGAQVPTDKPTYTWWGCVNPENGYEVPLGTGLTVAEALSQYGDMLLDPAAHPDCREWGAQVRLVFANAALAPSPVPAPNRLRNVMVNAWTRYKSLFGGQ